MPNITASKLKDDILDRLSNLAMTGQLPEGLQTKLQSNARVVQAMNQAVLMFVQAANLEAVSGFVSVGAPAADTAIGEGADGISNNVIVSLFPADTYAERENMGLSKVIINGNEYGVTDAYMSPISTVQHCANSGIYGPAHSVFNIDYVYKRIYTPKEADLKVRYVSYPEDINTDLTYGAAENAEIPISERYIEDIATAGLQKLLALASAIGSEQPEPEQEAQEQ